MLAMHSAAASLEGPSLHVTPATTVWSPPATAQSFVRMSSRELMCARPASAARRTDESVDPAIVSSGPNEPESIRMSMLSALRASVPSPCRSPSRPAPR